MITGLRDGDTISFATITIRLSKAVFTSPNMTIVALARLYRFSLLCGPPGHGYLVRKGVQDLASSLVCAAKVAERDYVVVFYYRCYLHIIDMRAYKLPRNELPVAKYAHR